MKHVLWTDLKEFSLMRWLFLVSGLGFIAGAFILLLTNGGFWWMFTYYMIGLVFCILACCPIRLQNKETGKYLY